jgi:hypothetical protein
LKLDLGALTTTNHPTLVNLWEPTGDKQMFCNISVKSFCSSASMERAPQTSMGQSNSLQTTPALMLELDYQ